MSKNIGSTIQSTTVNWETSGYKKSDIELMWYVLWRELGKLNSGKGSILSPGNVPQTLIQEYSTINTKRLIGVFYIRLSDKLTIVYLPSDGVNEEKYIENAIATANMPNTYRIYIKSAKE
jgi:hypothetical protein